MWARRTAALAVLVLATTLLSCTHNVHGYAFVPITSVFYGGASSGTASGDAAICLSKGGYLATEATEVLHAADIAAIADAIGATTDFYAYLGGGVNRVWNYTGGYSGFCPWIRADPEYPTNILDANAGDPHQCVFRWQVGRWQMMTSDVGVDVTQPNAGVAFYQGSEQTNGSIYNFPTWFFQSGMVRRPGVNRGRYVVLFQNLETRNFGLGPRWSDNYGLNGYSYAFNPLQSGIYMEAYAKATLPSFQTICQGQGPFRLNYEDPRASTPQKSDLQNLWWVIFLVILFVLCLIAYLIIACCQEREDMDEPPEDAPEWAEQETMERNVSKRYVSQRSFHGGVPPQSPSRSPRSSDESDSRTESSSVSKEERYDDEE